MDGCTMSVIVGLVLGIAFVIAMVVSINRVLPSFHPDVDTKDPVPPVAEKPAPVVAKKPKADPPPFMCWTDYPLWLSAIPFESRVNKQLPWPDGEPKIYHVELVSYDDNKYVVVRHEEYGLVEFKAGYIYPVRNFKTTKCGPIPRRTLNKPRFVNAIHWEDFEKVGVVTL